jgi:hypothetical protein
MKSVLLGAAITMMLGSIPQQDVFQRVMSANSEKAAARHRDRRLAYPVCLRAHVPGGQRAAHHAREARPAGTIRRRCCPPW